MSTARRKRLIKSQGTPQSLRQAIINGLPMHRASVRNYIHLKNARAHVADFIRQKLAIAYLEAGDDLRTLGILGELKRRLGV